MADVAIVAPLVTFESEDWNEGRDFMTTPQISTLTTTTELDAFDHRSSCRRLLDNLNGAQSTTRERQIDWTPPSTTNTTSTTSDDDDRRPCSGVNMAPRHFPSASLHQTSTDDDNQFTNNQIWNHVPENYDNSEAQIQRSKLESVSLQDSEHIFGEIDQFCEDDDGAEAMEMSILSITGSICEEPMKSADEVISEISEMMEDDFEAEFEMCSASPSKSTEVLKTKLQTMKQSNNGLSACLQEMPLESISSLQEELDQAIKDYSEVLLCQLVLREELVFQRELFNQFISLLLSIQKKRRTLDVDRRKGKTVAEPPSCRYLTTVIPYDDHQKTPDADLLQIYIKILSAIDEDNSKVPTLLTDYILNVLCPKS